MKMTLTKWQFATEFNKVRPDSFTIDALEVIFEHYEELDEEMEFDPVLICSEWCEYDNIGDLISDYPVDNSLDDYDTVEEFLEENYPSVITIDIKYALGMPKITWLVKIWEMDN